MCLGHALIMLWDFFIILFGPHFNPVVVGFLLILFGPRFNPAVGFLLILFGPRFNPVVVGFLHHSVWATP